jgi:nicotinamide mononucleotide transporter
MAPRQEREKNMSGLFAVGAIEWQYVLGYTPLEVVATVAAVLGVFLIARQNAWGWPIGIVWAGISTYLAFTAWDLVSDGILYAAYVPIQAYCWWVWIKKGGASAGAEPFVPTWMPRDRQAALAAAAVACIALWAFSISSLAERVAWIPAPALLVRDSTTTVLNFFAQFLQARKRMENWVGWLIVNVLGIHIYWVKESPIYSVQYAFFLVLGLYGWWQWSKSMRASRLAGTGSGA